MPRKKKVTKEPKEVQKKQIRPISLECVLCGSGNVIEVGRLQSTEYAGTVGDEAYTRVDRYRVLCKDCDGTSVCIHRV